MLLKTPIKHRNFDRATSAATTHAAHAPEGTIVFVAGPSGAGKSTLRRFLQTALYGPQEKWPNNQVLLASVRATNSESGYFSSKDFFSRLLASLGDPFRGNRHEDAVASIEAGETSEVLQFLADPLWRSIRISMTETRIRRAVECLGSTLGLKAILIDEGQSMCLTHVNRSPSDHLESLKCLAEELGILIYIFGTYDLLEIWNHSSQLNRRTRLIHLARYDSAVEGDRNAFFSVLRMLGKSLPLQDFRVLSEHADEILDWTFGVFGEVEALFERAQALAFSQGSEEISWSHISDSAYNPAQLARLKTEIQVGEARILGKAPEPEPAKKNRGGHGPTRPGRRRPGRDDCGVTA